MKNLKNLLKISLIKITHLFISISSRWIFKEKQKIKFFESVKLVNFHFIKITFL